MDRLRAQLQEETSHPLLDSPPPAREHRRTPIYARHHVLTSTVPPIAYDWVRFAFIREGSAVFHSEFGERRLERGDLAVLGANTLCGTQPTGSLATTVLYLDRDYVVDQVFWQYAGQVIDRLDASQLLADFYAEPAQILHLGEEAGALLAPRLDELVDLCQPAREPLFYRAQALLSEVLDVVTPQIRVTTSRATPTQRHAPVLGERRVRRPVPLREEARVAAATLRVSPSRRWTLAILAHVVHLSPAQLSRVFVEAYGRTPLAYLTVLRIERMALLLRTTNISVQEAAREVGWSSRSYAARVFQKHLGVSPGRYRTLAGRW